ncbi:hypothetical protein [Mesobaculum littorinae]|nr:hypothetical protein [Mesobaculum littorinae]
MSKSIKAIMALGFIAVVAACAQEKEEVVYVDPAPQPMVQPEPTYNKY